MVELALEARQLSKSFGALHVLRSASLAVVERDCVGIIGPNGAGKTTFLNLLTGSLRPSHGDITIYGQDVTKICCYKRARLGLIKTSQLTSLFLDLTIRENLAVALYATSDVFRQLRVGAFDDEICKLLELLDLTVSLDSAVGALSHGDQRVLEIALGLAMRPKILVLDEPTAGMSPRETSKFINLINARVKGQTTLLIIEHDMEVMKALVNTLAVLHQGQFIAVGNVDEILHNPIVNEVYLGNSSLN